MTHGYTGYATNGCRCDVCRKAKAEYMRAKRSEASRRRELVEAGGGRYLAEVPRHGLAGYRDAHCRCETCRAAASSAWKRERRHRA